MLCVLADNYQQAKLAADQYQFSSWRYIHSAQQLRGVQDAVVAIVGPCQKISHETYYILRRMHEQGRITTMRLPT